jgi:hypothetical protein
LAFTHKINENLAVGVHQHFDYGKIKSNPYNIGFEVDYKL